MPSREQLETALRNADAAGDTAAATQLATALKSGAYDQPEVAPQESGGVLDTVGELFTGSERTTPEIEAAQEIGAAPELNQLSVPAFKASLGLLTTGDTDSLKGILNQQFGGKVSYTEDAKGNTMVNLPSGQYALNKPGASPQDLVRGVFDFLSYTPAGKAPTVLSAVGRSVATEAAIEGAEESLGGDFSPLEVAASGALGGIFKGAENLIGAGYRAIKGKASSDVVEAGKDSGVTVFTSDVRQPQTFAGKTAQQTTEKIPFAGTGAQREVQQQMREDAVSQVAEKYGQFSYDAIVDSLKTQKDKVKNAAGSVLGGVGRKLDDIGEIPTSNTNQAIDSAWSELSKPGVIKSEQAVNDLDTLADSITSAPQTFTSLKENRTAFREIVAGADKAERSQLTSRAKSLLQKVESAMTKDMDSFARTNLSPAEFSKWKKANSVYASEAKNLAKSRLKSVLDKGDVTPESVQNLLFSQKPSEVKLLYKSLTGEGRANARSAIISKVVGDLNRRASGLTPSTFASEMKKYGMQTNEFFKGEEKRQLNGLIKVLDATRRAQDASVTTPTGQQLLGAGTLAAAATDLGATVGIGGTVGGFARLYESAPVRNALLRLDSIPKGSTRYEKALAEAFEVLNAGAQSAREQAQE